MIVRRGLPIVALVTIASVMPTAVMMLMVAMSFFMQHTLAAVC